VPKIKLPQCTPGAARLAFLVGILLGALLTTPSGASATALPSTITENMTLTAAGNPYTGSPTIEAGVTVKAEPGVRFNIGKMTVKGTLKAEGTAEEPVVFTSSAKEPTPGDWTNIKFESGSGGSVLDHAEVAYGAASEAGAVEINTSSPTITHTVFRKNQSSAIMVPHGGSPEIAHDTFIENGYYYAGRTTLSYNATASETGEVNIHDNVVEGGGGPGITVSDTSPGEVNVDNNTVENCSGVGISVSDTPTTGAGGSLGGNIAKGNKEVGLSYSGANIPSNITENTLTGNNPNRISISGTVAHSETWGNEGGALGLGEVTVAPGVTLTISPGVTLLPGKLTVKGTLKAEGTSKEPIAFTSGAKEPKPGEWSNIKLEAGSGGSVIDHAEVNYGAAGEIGAVEINFSSPTITHTVFRKNESSAIKVPHGGSPEIAHNTFIENGHYYLGRSTIDYTATASETGEVDIHDNVIEGSGGWGITVSDTSPGEVGINNNVVEYCNGLGISVSDSPATGAGGTVGGNSVIGCSETGLSYSGTSIPGNITENTLIGNGGSNFLKVSGTVTSSATWGKGAGTISLGEVTVATGVTLKVVPGVVVLPSSIIVKGTLKAEGTFEEPIIFTSGAKEPKPGEWSYIKFEPGSGESVLDHAEVAYGASSEAGALEINASSPKVTHTVFRENQSAGIKVLHGGSPEIAHDAFIHNGHYYFGRPTLVYNATVSEPGAVNIHDNFVEGGGGDGINVTNNSAVGAGGTLSGNTVIGNEGTGLSYTGTDIPGDITENTLSANTNNYISISGTVAHSSTWKKGGTIVRGSGEVTVASGVTLSIKPGVIFLPSSIIVKGTLKAEGTAEEPVVFTGSSEESAGEWSYIKFESGSGESVLDHVEVAYGGSWGEGMLRVEGSHPRITNSTIRKSSSYGIKVTESGTPRIEWNRFRNNANGISYSGTGNLSAPNNDWNCASGPKPAGCGDSVTSNVSWKPAVQLPELAGHCRGKESQCGEGADPVSLATGRLDYSHRDLLLPNKSAEPLELARAYTSGSSSDTGLGPGWSQTGLTSATELESGEVLILRQDGRQDLFKKTESGYESPSGVTDLLAKVEGNFQLTTLQNTVYRFDASGRIASITDDHGLKTTYGYSGEGRLSTITDPSAQTLTFSYNGSNHISSVEDSTGRKIEFGYSAAGDLETVTDALGGVTKYAYAQHRITSITDPRGNVILKNVYDGQGRIVEQRDGLEHLWKLKYEPGETIVTEPEGGKRKYGFDGQNRVISETDQLGHATAIAYDEAGNVKKVVQPGSAKWEFGHDSAGNLTSVKDPEGGERSYEYDGQNRLTDFTDARGNSWGYEWSEANDLTKITDPEEGETTLTYNESGQPLTRTDANGHKTEFAYDYRGNRTSETDPLSHKTSYGYNSRNYLTSKTAPGLKAEGFERNALGDLLARTTPEGNKTKYSYDANGLPTQITDPGEGVWKIEYNAMERPTLYTDPLEGQVKVTYNDDLKPTKVVNRRGKETTYAYDLADQLTEVHRPEGEDWTYGYDARGNRTSVVDPREGETTYEYDLLNRMTAANEPLEATTEYGYDADGDLASVTDPRGNTTSYGYDKLSRLIEVAQPLEQTTSFAYDGVGNQLSRTTGAGTLEFGYDAADRLTEVDDGESTLRSFGYDAADRLTSAVDAQSAEIEVGYDNDGLITSIDDGRGQSLTRSYNSRGLLTEQLDGRGTLEYGYDKLGRLTSLTDPQSKALSFAYDPEGDLTEVKRPNGVTTINVYNDAGRLAETSSEKAPSTVLEALEYGYDEAGNVTSKVDQRLEAETTYAYDALNRLAEFNPPGEGATAYGYDKAGNRTEAGETTYAYNALNQLTEASDGTAYNYDGAGRMIGKEKGSEETSYGWDLLDRLAKVEGLTETTSYAYDALGRLSERTSESGAQVVHYGDLTDLPTYDANGEGKTTTSYVQGAGGLIEQRSGETTTYPLADAHGDITAISGPTGGVESRQTYDPWGVQLSGPSLEMGFLGAYERRADPMSALIQMGERSYGPSLGSFLSEDPVFGHFGVGASVDRYLYVWDNPLNRYDLRGRDVCLPTPLGEACAGDAAEDIGKGVGSRSEDVWNWTAPGRHWISDRTQDFVKQIDFSTNEFIADSATILVGYGICAAATAGATAVGTPAAGGAVAATCLASDAVSFGGAVTDIFDKDNSLWTYGVSQ
jgi:RHS repeat-associated protein